MSSNMNLKIIVIFATIIALSVAPHPPSHKKDECNIKIILECFPSIDVSASVDLSSAKVSAEIGSKSSELISADVDLNSLSVSAEIGKSKHKSKSFEHKSKSSENELISVKGKLKSAVHKLLSAVAKLKLFEADISAEFNSKSSSKSSEDNKSKNPCKKSKKRKTTKAPHKTTTKKVKATPKPKITHKTTTPKPKKSTASTKKTTPRPCRAILILELIRIKLLRLSVKQQLLFDVCIKDIEAILLDVKLSLKVKVIKIAFHLKLFFLNNPDIELLIALEEIKGFGKVFEIILLGLKFNAVQLEAVIKPLDLEGNTHLTIALEKAILNVNCSIDIKLQIKLFIKFFKRICFKLDDDFKVERKHAYIAIVLRSFLSNVNASCLVEAILKAKINGVISVQEYLVFCDLFVSLSKIGPVVLSGDVNVNVFIKSLKIAINSNTTLTLFNASVIIEAKNFLKLVIKFFENETDVNLRLKFLIAQCALLSKPCHELIILSLDLDIDLKIHFCSLVSSSNLCINNNIFISVQAISEDFAECCKIDKHNNTDILIAIDVDLFAQLKTSVEIASFKSFRNSIFNCIHKIHPHDHKSAHKCCLPFVKQIFVSKVFARELLLKIILWPVFVQVKSNLVFGTLCDFCGLC
ncbi:hypothetical protein ACQ4LE_010062 [Meloidogyne hapla]|uniref:MI domain-containing protein n=1 Tax=Meloidogyne hapla TaxID=6305 RepID=A0A1I8B6R5_MELHA